VPSLPDPSLLSTNFRNGTDNLDTHPNAHNDTNTFLRDVIEALGSGVTGVFDTLDERLASFGGKNPLMGDFNQLGWTFSPVTQAMPTSLTSVYTCPAGKKAIPLSMFVQNTTAGGLTYSGNIVPSGGSTSVNNQFANAVAVGANSLVSFNGGLLQAGDSIWLSASGAGLNIHLAMLVMDASEPLVLATLSQVPNADTFLYECPAGKQVIVGLNTLFGTRGFFSNTSGGSVSLDHKIKPSGGAITWMDRFAISANASPLTLFGGLIAVLNAGDQVYVNATAASAINVWAVFIEQPIGG